MIDPGLFVKGIVVGLMIAAPVGPIGVLCVRRTLSLGPVVGLCSGLGAAVADAAYGAIAAFGLSFIADFLMWINRVSGILILGFGIVAIVSGAYLFNHP